jgi:hypothetical protein
MKNANFGGWWLVVRQIPMFASHIDGQPAAASRARGALQSERKKVGPKDIPE